LNTAGQTIIVRVNGIESGLTGFDLEAVTCPDLHAVMVAKIAGPDDIKEAAHLLNFFERKNGVEAGATLIWPLLETAEGIYRAYETGAASAPVAHMAASEEAATWGARSATRPRPRRNHRFVR
jgi:citrate lyase subunit beta/citryl-CoA lyase